MIYKVIEYKGSYFYLIKVLKYFYSLFIFNYCFLELGSIKFFEEIFELGPKKIQRRYLWKIQSEKVMNANVLQLIYRRFVKNHEAGMFLRIFAMSQD